MNDFVRPFESSYEDYCRDESRRSGNMSAISFPEDEAGILKSLRWAVEHGKSVTVQGSRTGIVGGAVPAGGLAINLSRMNRIGEPEVDADGESSIIVAPGAILSDVRKVAEMRGLFFPPDPTETSASIGGMVACNASGAMTFHYGSTRHWARALRVVLPNGDAISIRRGEVHAKKRSFTLSTAGGATISGTLPSYVMPNVKSAAGYFCADDMDLIDLFIGMEGTLGIVSEVDLRLIRKPMCVYGITVFLPSEAAAMTLVRILRGGEENRLSVVPVAIEFFNKDALQLLREMRSTNSAFEGIPTIVERFHSAVYAEFHGDDEEALDEMIMELSEIIIEVGGSEDDTWLATNEKELERLKQFRHATPEAVNLLIDQRRRGNPGITKLGTDMSVPDSCLQTVLEMYNGDLDRTGLESVIFGHIGNNHLHVNIIPRDLDEFAVGKTLYLDWARKVVQMGGSVSAEHGIGKIKTPFLEIMYGADAIAEMRNLRALFDPAGMLNPGDLF